MNHPFKSFRAASFSTLRRSNARDYGGYINEGEPLDANDRIHRVTDGISNLEALRNIFLVNERALFEWIVSSGACTKRGRKTIPVICSGFGISRIIPMSV